MLEELWICKIFSIFIWWIEYLYCVLKHVLRWLIAIKMHRAEYAEKQLRVMQQIDEDHTLTQLASAWLNLAVV